MERPGWDEHFLNIAKQVAQRGTCIRRKFGAVIVREHVLLSTGYVGAPRGTPNCIDLKKCYRQARNIPSGSNYELCRSVHAEQNAIINAAREGVSVKGGILYLYGENPDGSIVAGKPCKMCRRMIINAGIRKVIIKAKKGKIIFKISDWVKEARRNPFKELDEKGY